jgi:hypothetical protein
VTARELDKTGLGIDFKVMKAKQGAAQQAVTSISMSLTALTVIPLGISQIFVL